MECWLQIQFTWGRTEKGLNSRTKYHQEHREELRKLAAEHRRLHPEKDKNYYKENKAHIIALTGAYQKHHPEKRLEYQRRYRGKKGADWVQTLVRNSRARLRGPVGKHTPQDIKRLLWFQNGLCQYCLQKMERYTVDHMTPLIRGGSNKPSNLCLACLSCNSRKSFRTADEFFQLLESA